MTPVSADEAATHELFSTVAAKAYVDHERRVMHARLNVRTTMPAASSLAAALHYDAFDTERQIKAAPDSVALGGKADMARSDRQRRS